MQLDKIDHMTIRCRQQDLPAMEHFYGTVMGLKVGKRPDFAFPGLWFYLDDTAVVHIAARLDALPAEKGAYDHVSFKSRDIEGTRQHLRALGVSFDEAPVPGFPLHQIFMNDPAGAKVELTFDLPERAMIDG